MTLQDLNILLSDLAQKPDRETVLEFAFAVLEWMGLLPNKDSKPQLLAPQTQKLKDFLLPAPVTSQPQLYRLSADSQAMRVRFAVLKKTKKEYISQLVDNDPGGSSFQAAIKGIVNIPGRPAYIPSEPYFIHFITTPAYDRLTLVFNKGDQKRIITFRNRLTHTQYNRIIEQWHGIAAKSKPEISDLFWKSLDIKEVNKEFYKQIKERFDALVGIAAANKTKATESQVKQFAVRLIGRYIFCWFLKEKGIIPETLLCRETILNTKDFYRNILLKLFFETLNTKVQDREILPEYFQKIPYLNGGLFDENDEDKLFRDLEADEWLKPFVQVLENYDFTVDESSSNYQHVAVDPEMLGRIFENLLASQNEETEKLANQRKAFGAFYTPREIVDYMVNESLQSYLQTSWEEHAKAEEKPKIDKALTALFGAQANADGLKKEDKNLLLTFLSQIKILDPACGSGAFPMGVLQKLMELHETLGTVKSSYELKKDILSQNIYGVDIMPMAIEIARLRAWLSLVLEEDYKQTDAKHNYGLKPLPNLDFKFVCANSLIDLGLEEVLKNDTMRLYKRYYEMLKDLEEMRVRFFLPDIAHIEKETLKQQYIEQRDKVVAEIEEDKNEHLKKIADKIKAWNPFDDSKPSPFFSPTWMFGIDKGFDVVIGNPPYVRVQNLSHDTIDNYKKLFKTAWKRIDISTLFFEFSYNILSSKGHICFISSNQFIASEYGRLMRKFLIKRKPLKKIVDFGDLPLFESALTYVSIFILSKKELNSFDYHKITKLPFEYPSFFSNIEISGLNEDPWSLGGKDKIDLIKRIDFKSERLKESAKCSYGIVSGADDIFILHDEKIDELGIEKKCLLHLLRANNCSRYEFAKPNLFILYPFELKNKKTTLIPLQELKNKFPNTFKYLKSNQKELEQRKDSRTTFENTDNWYSLTRFGQLDIFNKQKIVFPGEQNHLKFGIDNSNSGYSGARVFGITITDSDFNIKTLLAILNSSLIEYYIHSVFPLKQGGYFSLSSSLVDKLPIRKPKSQKRFIALVDDVMEGKIKTKNTSTLEKEIDIMVYHLYNLTYEEAKIIDPELSEEEYEKYGVEAGSAA